MTIKFKEKFNIICPEKYDRMKFLIQLNAEIYPVICNVNPDHEISHLTFTGPDTDLINFQKTVETRGGLFIDGLPKIQGIADIQFENET